MKDIFWWIVFLAMIGLFVAAVVGLTGVYWTLVIVFVLACVVGIGRQMLRGEL